MVEHAGPDPGAGARGGMEAAVMLEVVTQLAAATQGAACPKNRTFVTFVAGPGSPMRRP